ncbi:MAG: hypothetical protein LBU99_03355 [Spirochaetaceae bacterium]|jgi:hypothetical protein|nr:hypothetical protein [Spirochaetaceae bacterium]
MMTAETILVLVLGLVNIGLWIVFFLFFRSRFSPSSILREIRIEVDKLVTEISREADRDIALIEGRIRGLKALVEEADKRILLADKESRRRVSDEKVYTEVATASSMPPDSVMPPAPVVPVEEALSRYRRTGRADGSNPSPAEKGESSSPSSEVSSPEMPEVVRAAQMVTPKVPVRDQVIYLARTGFPAEMIAERLSLTVGEVELTIALYAGEV